MTEPTATAPLIVLTTLPDPASAQALAAALVEGGLAACVNVLAPCTSVYRWQGRLETAAEVPLLIKTTRAAYAALEAEIRTRHPYELPEIVAVPVERGLPAYLDWVRTNAAPPLPPPARSDPSAE
ncbi:divalent-cation tolerance protein CutA [Thauera chlorobenzoica]|uniref:Divalent cation tolerance protein cutA n=1 Tax=Thauera chlorobenzoica TaxID=96773 RepID=A0A1H5SYT6_9RHOO|nr:divalent-cation tolerance protein CutA [Thauera chlorobenzoica]APR04058.1 divalent cation tolerance protein cutA [Thauera chlorobenzoica]SEF54947.1 divalent cation tolerance protein [Thauera chlorobenzoica]